MLGSLTRYEVGGLCVARELSLGDGVTLFAEKYKSTLVFLAVFCFHLGAIFYASVKPILPPTDEVPVVSAIAGQPIYDVTLSERGSQNLGADAVNQRIFEEQQLSEPPGVDIPLPELSDDYRIINPNAGAERYFRFDELSRSAFPLHDFVVPSDAAILLEINAKVEVYVGRDGVVQDVKVLLINVPSFAEKLKATILATEFKPATRNGFPVNSIKVMEIVIRI